MRSYVESEVNDAILDAKVKMAKDMIRGNEPLEKVVKYSGLPEEKVLELYSWLWPLWCCSLEICSSSRNCFFVVVCGSLLWMEACHISNLNQVDWFKLIIPRKGLFAK